MNVRSKKTIFLVIGIILSIISIVVGFVWTNIEFHTSSFAYLDDKISSVMGLTASTTSVATAISALPGDMGSPIADQMMDFSGQFLLVLCGLYLEKYLLILTGYASFWFLFPISALLRVIYEYSGNTRVAQLSKKICLFAILIVLTIPISIEISKTIDDIHQVSTSELIEKSNEISDLTDEIEETEEDLSLWESIKEGAQDAAESILQIPDEILKQAEQLVSEFVETIAVMIITACIIPMTVFIVLIWGSKMILGLEYNIGTPRSIYGARPKIKAMKFNKGKGSEK